MRGNIIDYLLDYEHGGSAAVWSSVIEHCPTEQERREEVDEIEACGWLVRRHYTGEPEVDPMDEVYFEPRTRRHG